VTLDDIKRAIKGHCNLTSPEADTRVGETVNRHHRRITAELGLDATRFVTRTVSTTAGVQAVEFTEIEKIDRILDTTDSGSIRLLREVSIHEQRANQTGTGQPSTWAPRDAGANTVTVLLDTLPQSAYTLQADGRAALADLQGDDSPSFPESFHDILTFYGISEELLRKEKLQVAAAFEQKADKLLAELRHFLADSATRDDRQGHSGITTLTGGSSGSGSGTLGATAYTQSALVTFDLGAGVAPFAVAQSNAPTVTNLDADQLDGEDGTFYLDRANHTGTLTVTPADISGVTTDSLVGRDAAGAGVATSISMGGGIEFSGSNTLMRSALTGDVTASAGSAVTTIANLAVATGKIAEDAVTDAKLRESAACSVIGRSANSVGNPADITASSNHTLLARVADVVAWVAGLAFDGAGRIIQIAFAASHNPSSDANTLDDYEEGTWTPVDSSGAALSFTSVEAYYVKIGQLVTVTARLTYPATGDGTVNVIGGLPFTIQDTTANVWMAPVINTSGTIMALEGINNTTTTTVINASSSSSFTNANLSTLTIRFTFSFRATA
jgi:hypothetical protein